LLEREARHLGVSLKKIPDEDLLRVASEHGCAKLEDLLAGLGYGKYSARQILAKAAGANVTEAEPPGHAGEKPAPAGPKRTAEGQEPVVLVRGQDDLMVFRAKCCSPIPGDEIIGYVTRGRGVAVHSTRCPNVQNLLYQSERRIAVQWAGEEQSQFPVTILIRALDRAGLLADITNVISGAGSNIRALESRPDQLNARVEATLEIVDQKQLESILAEIKKISGVYDVERVYKV
jgi:GTP pyrophosphokinase